jgi:hypothetical protein
MFNTHASSFSESMTEEVTDFPKEECFQNVNMIICDLSLKVVVSLPWLR